MRHLAGAAQSPAEICLAVSTSPCPSCAERAVEEPTLRRVAGGQIASCRCGACDTEWDVHVSTVPGYPVGGVARHRTGAEPSTLLRAEDLDAEIRRIVTLVHRHPPELAPSAWRANAALVDRGLICVAELVALGGDDDTVAAGAALDAVAAAHAADAPRLWAATSDAPLQNAVPEGALDASAIDAHRGWLRVGRRGPGRLVVRHVRLARTDLVGQDLSGAVLEDLDLAGADLSSATFAGAEWTALMLCAANLQRVRLHDARLDGCDLTGARADLAWFDGASVTGCTFDGASLDRSSWTGAVVRGATFRGAAFANAALDGATFTGCSFTGADLGLVAPQPMGTNHGTRFERCDLRGARWDGRDLADVVVVDCLR